MFDGDNMGKWLSGEEYIKEENKLQDFHKFLSQKLLNFANEVKKIDNLVTVYAGGEDFLGFVNINYLFEILQLLRDRWNEIVNKPLKKEFDLNKENFTFSAGVVIAHYKTPLSEVLKSVRGAEKKAKEAGRDRICFRVLKRSGEIREGILEYKKLLYLKEIKDEIIKHDISDSFISYLEKEFLIMCEENGELRLSRRSSMLKAEIIRLLQRRKSANQKFDEKLLSEKMLKLTSNNFRIFIDLLYIVKFLKREVYVNSH
jgi:CRISPR-associated protein Cmr2